MTLRYGVVPPAEATSVDGIVFLRDMLARKHPAPPISETMGFTLTEVDEGLAVFEGTPTAAFLNPLSTIHGGWTATILDSALGCAVHTMVKAGQGYTTIEMKMNLVRALQPGVGPVRCEGRVVHMGRNIATSDAKLFLPDGKLAAHATETCMIFAARV